MGQIRKLVIDMLLFEKGKAYGFQEYMLNLLNYLYEHRSEILFDHIILVCLQSQKENLGRYADRFVVKDYACNSMIKRFFLQTWFPFDLRLDRCDVLLSPGNYCGLIKRCQSVLVIHDLLFKRKDLLPKPLMRLQRNIFVPISIKAADTIIAISNFTKDDVQSYYPVSASKIKTIYNYFNFEKFSDASASPYSDYFLSVCSEEVHKNSITVLDAYVAYCRRGGQRKLVMVGKIRECSPVADRLEIMEKSIRERIITCSHISNQELASLYLGADAYISASLFEGLGMPIVEAMSFNLPVILSDIPIMHEVSMEQGLYFSPTNASELCRLMLELKAEKRDYAKDIKKMYSAEYTSRQYLKTINSFAKEVS